MQHTLSGREQVTVMKLVVRASDRRVLGIHVLGDEAAEIIQGFAVACVCGATKEQLDATIGIHPTAAEELVTMREPIIE
jgi:glutathione reductase (NADPH)